MNTVHSELAWHAPNRRGRPPKSKVDLFRERVLRTVIAQLPNEVPQCRFDRSAVLRGGALTRAREARIAEHFPIFAEAARWPLQLLETREARRSRLMQLIETYECEPSYLLGHRRVELPLAVDGQVIFFPAGYPESLLRRGDLYGYLALLTQFRLSALNNDVVTQWVVARYLVRSLPGACLHSAVLAHARTLISLTMRVLKLIPHTCVPVKVDRHRTLALVRSRSTYLPDSTRDPLTHFSLQACETDRATILFPHAP